MISSRSRWAMAVGVGLLAVLSSCSPAEETVASSTTATIPDATTSTLAPEPSTTTTARVTTTTTDATTTTTLAPSTTTTAPSELWAAQPLVVAGFGALGWWDGSGWIWAGDEGSLPVAGGETYQIAGIGFEATTTGGPETIVCGPVDNLGVILESDELLGSWPGPYGVAISAPWELQPHIFEAFEDDGTYAGIASQLLASRGLDVADPIIKQLFRVDLEGDGTNEILVVAEDAALGFEPEPGDYSIVFMRKVVQGEVQTAVIDETVITDPEGAFTVSFTVGSVADLSGDGKMEIVLNAAYYEGLSVEVWEYTNDDLGLINVIGIGCGA